MKLTPKQQNFVNHIVNNPKASATEAAAQAYKVSNRNVAKSIAHENLTKPDIVTALAQHNNLVENTIINTIQEYKDSEELPKRVLAVNSSMWVHDKLHGKATQRTESTNVTVNIGLDLTGVEQG